MGLLEGGENEFYRAPHSLWGLRHARSDLAVPGQRLRYQLHRLGRGNRKSKLEIFCALRFSRPQSDVVASGRYCPVPGDRMAPRRLTGPVSTGDLGIAMEA